MPDSEWTIDKLIDLLQYMAGIAMTYKDIIGLPGCVTCGKVADCDWRPKENDWPVINCPHWGERGQGEA